MYIGVLRVAPKDLLKQNPNTSMFASNGYTTPQGNTPNVPKMSNTINAFGKDLVVFENKEGRQFVMVPDANGQSRQVFLDDPLFNVKESAYQDLTLRVQNLDKSLDNQIATHQKWYNHWMEKLGIAQKNYEDAIPVRDENHVKFGETLSKAGCTYLELQSTTPSNTKLYALKDEADEYYGLEHDAQRKMWRSQSEQNFFWCLALDEKKWMNGIYNIKRQTEQLFSRMFI